ncbi:TetR/AcrR family transcriptional regulator [candidate division KSB1 bacterium]|nr:TetR/AcrR family transcriptional regulator [candidate division KSB1 bacterium]
MTDFTDIQFNILNSAIDLIAEKGIQQLTIKNLAGKIGKTEGAIYRHFEKKTDILCGILQIFKEYKISMQNKIQEKKSSTLMQLKEVMNQHFQMFSDKPAMAAVIFSEEIFQNEKQLADTVFAIMQETQHIVSSLIEQGQRSGQIRKDISPEQLSIIVMGSLRLMVTRWRLSRNAFDLQNEGTRLWESIEKILTR